MPSIGKAITCYLDFDALDYLNQYCFKHNLIGRNEEDELLPKLDEALFQLIKIITTIPINDLDRISVDKPSNNMLLDANSDELISEKLDNIDLIDTIINSPEFEDKVKQILIDNNLIKQEFPPEEFLDDYEEDDESFNEEEIVLDNEEIPLIGESTEESTDLMTLDELNNEDEDINQFSPEDDLDTKIQENLNVVEDFEIREAIAKLPIGEPLSRKQIANCLKIDPSYLSNWKKGKRQSKLRIFPFFWHVFGLNENDEWERKI